MNRRQFLSGAGGASVAIAAGCLGSEERTDVIIRNIEEFLESDSAYSEEIAVLDAVEVEESEFTPDGVSIGLRHLLPFTTSDDPEEVRNAVNSNSYRIAEVSLEKTDDIHRIEMNSYVSSDTGSSEVSFVDLRWDVFDEVEWTNIGLSDVPGVATRYYFDKTALLNRCKAVDFTV